MEDQAQQIKKEILKVKDVAKVELSGIQNRTIEVNVDPTLLTQRGVSVTAIAQAFEKQNKIVDAGAIESEESRLRVDATGSFTSLEEIENLTVVSHHGDYFRLGEIAKNYRIVCSSSPQFNVRRSKTNYRHCYINRCGWKCCQYGSWC